MSDDDAPIPRDAPLPGMSAARSPDPEPNPHRGGEPVAPASGSSSRQRGVAGLWSGSDDPRQTGQMTFLEHLDALRGVLMRVVIAGGLGAIAGWLLAPRVLEDLIHRTVRVAIVLTPMEAFNERFKISLLIGVLVTGPYIFYQLWAFVVPGLLKRERSLILPMAMLSMALFMAGVGVAYVYVVPLVIAVLSRFLTPGMQAQFRLSEVLSFFYNVALACGVICQLPLVTMTLTALGLVTPGFLLRQWRYALVGAFILTAAITPGDVVTAQLILGGPMVLLYFLSVGLSWFVARRKREGAADGIEEVGRA